MDTSEMSCETNLNSDQHGHDYEYESRHCIEHCNPGTEVSVMQCETSNNTEECSPEQDRQVPVDNQCMEHCNIENNLVIQSAANHSFEQHKEGGTENENSQCDEHSIDKPLEKTKHSLKEHTPHNNVVTFLELSKSSWSRSPNALKEVQPYLRGCKWSPDGTCCLTVVNSDGVHICELSRDLYEDSPPEDRIVDVLDSVVHVKEAGLVYDFCWYPLMNSEYPESCCWITTLQNTPIQMWDAFDGSLRCSYRGFNAVDEMEPALTVSFTPDGSKIIAGYKKVLRTFDVNSPGRDCAEHKISNPAACLAVHTNLLAVGSWNTSVSLYNISETGTYKSIGKIYGHSGGVTHMKFSPNGLYLVTGARNDSKLLVWDIRFYRRPLNIFSRHVDTNQRIYFDISPCGKQLASGGTDGVVRIWKDWHMNEDNPLVDNDNAIKYPLHNDCCNSLSFHPLRPIIATGSGQYHFQDPLLRDDSEDKVLSDTDLATPNVNHKYSSVSENSLSFWWIAET